MNRIAGILSLIVLSGCASAPIYSSLYQSTPVVVDGNASDWKVPLTYYDKDSKLNFSVSNDTQNLYFCFAAYDMQLEQRIIHSGMQIWIDTMGGKAQQIGLLYPDPATMMPPDKNRRMNPEASSEDFDPIGTLRRAFLRSPGEMELTGFPPPIGGITPLHNAFGIQACVNWDTINNTLYYEAAIPLQDILHEHLAPHDTSRIIGLTFTLNAARHSEERERGNEGVSHGDGDEPGGVAGEPGGGFGGGGDADGGGGMGRHGGQRGHGSRPGRDNGTSTAPQTLWFKLRLAANSNT